MIKNECQRFKQKIYLSVKVFPERLEDPNQEIIVTLIIETDFSMDEYIIVKTIINAFPPELSLSSIETSGFMEINNNFIAAPLKELSGQQEFLIKFKARLNSYVEEIKLQPILKFMTPSKQECIMKFPPKKLLVGRRKEPLMVNLRVWTTMDADNNIKLDFDIPELNLARIPSSQIKFERVESLLEEFFDEVGSYFRGGYIPFAVFPGWGNRLFGELEFHNVFNIIERAKYQRGQEIGIESITINTDKTILLSIPWELLSEDGRIPLSVRYPIGRRLLSPESYRSAEKFGRYDVENKLRIGVIASHIRYMDIDIAKNPNAKFWVHEDKEYHEELQKEIEIFNNVLPNRFSSIADIEFLEIDLTSVKFYHNGVFEGEIPLLKLALKEYSKIVKKRLTVDDIIGKNNKKLREGVLNELANKVKSITKNFLSKGFDILHILGEGVPIEENHKIEVAFLISQFSDCEGVSKDFQLMPADIIDARKGQRSLFMIFGNFCFSSFITPESLDAKALYERIDIEKLKKFFLSTYLTITENYIGPIFYIRARAALEFCSKFYNLFLRKLESDLEVQIGKVLRDAKKDMYELQGKGSVSWSGITWLWVVHFGEPLSTLRITV